MYDPIGLEKRLKWIQKEIDRLDPADFGNMTPTVFMYARQNADHLMGDLATLERYYKPRPRRK